MWRIEKAGLLFPLVSQFCREWHINRRTFYRAKAELIANGKLEEHIKGSVNLRVPPLSQNDSPVTNLSPRVINPTHPETAQTQPAAKSSPQQSFPDSPDPSQLPSNSSLKKREKIASLSPELEQPNSQEMGAYSKPTSKMNSKMGKENAHSFSFHELSNRMGH